MYKNVARMCYYKIPRTGVCPRPSSWRTAGSHHVVQFQAENSRQSLVPGMSPVIDSRTGQRARSRTIYGQHGSVCLPPSSRFRIEHHYTLGSKSYGARSDMAPLVEQGFENSPGTGIRNLRNQA